MEAGKSPIKDKALHDLQSIPKSAGKIKVGKFEDCPSLFIEGQPQPLIIYDYLEKVSSPIREGEFNRLAELIAEIYMITEEINMISE